jgi:hypothetical protein
MLGLVFRVHNECVAALLKEMSVVASHTHHDVPHSALVDTYDGHWHGLLVGKCSLGNVWQVYAGTSC